MQLLHELPDGSSHVDWLISRDPGGTGPLESYRLPGRLDELEPGREMPATRVPDHRPTYLSYEGPVSGGRGRVRRLCEGRAFFMAPSADRPVTIEAVVRWRGEGGREVVQRLRLSHRRADQWVIRTVPERKL